MQRSPLERTSRVVSRFLFAFVVLVVFLGLAFLTYEGQLDGEAVVLFAGVILGYLARAVRDRV